jgi:NAD(P)H-hydrate epimerase
LVTLGFPKGLYDGFLKRLTEVMLLPLPQTPSGNLSDKGLAEVLSFLKRADVLLIGPGLGREAATQRLVRGLLGRTSIAAVVDADGLYALAGHMAILKKRKSECVLTPHPGEMARLCGMSASAVQKDRKSVAKNLALRYNITLVLKGHQSVVASSRGNTYVNRTGNPGMATAGSGDVLAGVIAALMGQGFSAFDAARWGVYIHGLAGDMCARVMTQPGLIATDIVSFLPKAFKRLR